MFARSVARLSRTSMARRAFSVTPEFTLHKHDDSSDFGFGRGSQFCMLTLRRDTAFTTGDTDTLYIDKNVFADGRIRKLFSDLDVSRSGGLDRTELMAGLQAIGLPTTEAQVEETMHYFDRSGDGEIQADEFVRFLEDTWGRPLTVEFSSNLGAIGLEGTRAISWVGRSVPAHFVLRALRQLWPHDVEDIAIMRNEVENPELDPQMMTVHDRTYVASVSESTARAVALASELLEQEQTAKGGFSVRIISGGEEVYVPLRGIAMQFGAQLPGDVANKPPSGSEWFMRFGVYLGGGSIILNAACLLCSRMASG